MYVLLFAGLAAALTVLAVTPALSRETDNKIEQEIERRLAYVGVLAARLQPVLRPHLLSPHGLLQSAQLHRAVERHSRGLG